MSVADSLALIEGAHSITRDLYRRAKDAGPEFDNAVTVVRRLHAVLKHLKAEAEDTESHLNASERSAIYQRKLTRIIEDCEFALQSLEALLTKHTETPGFDEADHVKLNTVVSQLTNEKNSIDVFLDTVQLPNITPKVVDPNDGSLDAIKDKVDAIAARLFKNRNGECSVNDEDEMWQEFRVELEKEGFSTEVLKKNKEVLRAYIRELDTKETESGSPPTVRGLLEQEQAAVQRPELAVVPASYEDRAMWSPKEMNQEAWSPKEVMHPTFDNDKYAPSMKFERRMPEQHPYAPSLPQQQSALSYERHSSDDDADRHGDPDQLALISTRDLMAMDGLGSQMNALQIQNGPSPVNYSISPTSSATTKYLPPSVSANIHPPAGSELALSSSPSQFSSSPRYAPLPTYSQAQNTPPPPYNVAPRQPSRLAPDRYGMDIPLDAKWTRIRRALISPEVLERAGVRYEARPTYVAVLGILTREEIAHYAQLSMHARSHRSSHSNTHRPPPSTFEQRYNPEMRRDGSTSSRSPEQKNWAGYGQDTKDKKMAHGSDSDSVLWDESDTDEDYDEKRPRDERRRRPYIIVPPPDKGKDGASPAATVQPKPILKNKNENHVHFGPDPYEVSQDEAKKSPTRSSRDSGRDRDRDRDRDRPRRRREKEYHDPDRDNRVRDRERGDREYYSTSSRRNREYRDSGRDSRDRDRDRERDRDAKDRKDKDKKKWAPTIGAMGIGGAAGSLLSVLTDAASGL
ncbi:hypothetical protein F5X68DRAFT_175790 [Plectosphaerella plurivora]|uniref:DUF8035 domain-containing protein n=1 Tax=Plectosphaerella plurivora TaxID=936078 RepID=A0A9P9A4N7_9PEZI|nr:hypothetical protein F5X68DRAFT_175790 [Plectosphaerella plurivora]